MLKLFPAPFTGSCRYTMDAVCTDILNGTSLPAHRHWKERSNCSSASNECLSWCEAGEGRALQIGQAYILGVHLDGERG